MRICMFGTYEEHRHPRVAIIAQGLRDRGYSVVDCNVPWSATTDERLRAVRSPMAALRSAAKLARAWLRLWKHARGLSDVDVVIVGYLGVLDIHMAKVIFRDSVIILDHLAPVQGILSDRGFGRLFCWLGRSLDRLAERRADALLADTDEHATAMRGKVVVVPVGAPTAWFRSPGQDAGTSPLRVIFFGLFTPLHGTRTIASALAEAEDAGASIEVTMIGAGQDVLSARQILGTRRNVTWHSWVEASRLPELVASHHVCLGIFGTTPKAARVVPNKVFQGAAAGCAIVTGDTQAQRRVLGDAAVFVPAGDASALARAIMSLASDPEEVIRLRSAASHIANEQFRPVQVVAPLAQHVRTLVPWN